MVNDRMHMKDAQGWYLCITIMYVRSSSLKNNYGKLLPNMIGYIQIHSLGFYTPMGTSFVGHERVLVAVRVTTGRKNSVYANSQNHNSRKPYITPESQKIHHFDPSIQKLANDMFETMHAARGVGLAAPQIAQSIRLFVAEFEDHKVAIVNPEIVKAEGEVLGTEGCLSIPGYVGENIRRAEKVVVKGQDVRGKNMKVNAEGWFARVLQHEIDHLDGILFLDRLDRPEDLHEISEDDEEFEEEVEAVV